MGILGKRAPPLCFSKRFPGMNKIKRESFININIHLPAKHCGLTILLSKVLLYFYF